MAGRGRLKVGQDSWHWRWYNEWRRNKGLERTARNQVDLCHYMRVLLIFGPWRWFWEGDMFAELPAFFYVIFLGLVSLVVWAFVSWPTGALIVLGIMALVVVAAAVIFAIGYAIRRWYVKDTAAADAFIERVIDRIEKFCYYAFFPIWWPLYWLAIWIKRGGIKFGHGFVRVGNAFFSKRLFNVTIGGELVSVSAAGIVIPLIALAGIAAGFYSDWVKMSLTLGSILGAILVVVALVLLGQRIRRWSKENAAKPLSKPAVAAEPKEPSVLWAWMVAKKHRVCPLIETDAGGGGSRGTANGTPGEFGAWRIPDPK